MTAPEDMTNTELAEAIRAARRTVKALYDQTMAADRAASLLEAEWTDRRRRAFDRILKETS